MARLTKHIREDFGIGAPHIPPPDWMVGVIIMGIIAFAALFAYALGW